MGNSGSLPNPSSDSELSDGEKLKSPTHNVFPWALHGRERRSSQEAGGRVASQSASARSSQHERHHEHSMYHHLDHHIEHTHSRRHSEHVPSSPRDEHPPGHHSEHSPSNRHREPKAGRRHSEQIHGLFASEPHTGQKPERRNSERYHSNHSQHVSQASDRSQQEDPQEILDSFPTNLHRRPSSSRACSVHVTLERGYGQKTPVEATHENREPPPLSAIADTGYHAHHLSISNERLIDPDGSERRRRSISGFSGINAPTLMKRSSSIKIGANNPNELQRVILSKDNSPNSSPNPTSIAVVSTASKRATLMNVCVTRLIEESGSVLVRDIDGHKTAINSDNSIEAPTLSVSAASKDGNVADERVQLAELADHPTTSTKPGPVTPPRNDDLPAPEAPTVAKRDSTCEPISVALPSISRQSTRSKKKLPRYNSCSTLFVDQTIVNSDMNAMLKCVSKSLHHTIVQQSKIELKKTHDILSERLHPLSKRIQFCTKIPSTRDIFKFLECVFQAAELPVECAPITLVYIERMLRKTGVNIQMVNWARITLGGLLLASKVWDDHAVWNIDFCQIFPDVPVADMNELERWYMHSIDYDVSVKCSVYTQYYFKLRDLADKKKLFDLKPLTLKDVKILEARIQEIPKSEEPAKAPSDAAAAGTETNAAKEAAPADAHEENLAPHATPKKPAKPIPRSKSDYIFSPALPPHSIPI